MATSREIVNLEIEHLAPGGDGVGRVDGQTCYVPLTAPGDRIRARIVERRRRFLSGEIEEMVSPGPERRPPPCPLFGECGGCRWLHLEEACQERAKAAVLSRALKQNEVPFHGSPDALGYRAVSRLHAAPEADTGRGILGFWHRTHREIVPIAPCPILTPPLNRALEGIARGLIDDIQHAMEVRLILGDDGPVASVSSEHPLPARFYQKAEALVPDPLAGIALRVEGISAQGAGQTKIVTTGVDGHPFETPGMSFGQANRPINRLIARTVSGWIAQGEYRTALELFAGAGNLTVALAPHVEKYTASELDGGACKAAEKNFSSRGMKQVNVYPGDALEVYRKVGDAAQLIVLDPPRSGHRELAKAIGGGGHRAVLYVSCNPGTLARDLAELKSNGYKLKEAAGFDMFPQTPHLEAAVLMER